jgi:hypothetical protein
MSYVAPSAVRPDQITYSSFSGADIVCSVTVPVLTNDKSNPASAVLKPVTIGSLQMISISSHRDSVPVRAFKHVDPKGFTRGGRTTAGSLVFTVFDRAPLQEVQHIVRSWYQNAHKLYAGNFGNSIHPDLIPRLQADELPPFDVTITLANEYGNAAVAKIYGIQIVTSGKVMGIDEIQIEDQMSYMALGYEEIYPGFPGQTQNQPPKVK